MLITKNEKQIIDEYVLSWGLQDELNKFGYDYLYDEIKDLINVRIRLFVLKMSDIISLFVDKMKKCMYNFVKSLQKNGTCDDYKCEEVECNARLCNLYVQETFVLRLGGKAQTKRKANRIRNKKHGYDCKDEFMEFTC